jgi:hypothetical protein
MPNVGQYGPYRVFFYSNEGFERPHVHIERDDSVAKFWLDPVDLAKKGNFKAYELTKLRELVVEHQTEWLEKWHEHFGT